MAREVVFDLDAAAFSSDEFRMFHFKVTLLTVTVDLFAHQGLDPRHRADPLEWLSEQVKRCPRARPHDWTQAS